MEFDELQQIWDSQNSRPLYAIDEKALHHRILAKKKQAYHITNFTELLLIVVNLAAAGFILAVNLTMPRGNISLYLAAAWMLGTFLYSLVSRIRRIKGEHRFDRSMLGDLHHAISVASYQVRLSRIMRWNILPIGALVLLSIWEGGKSLRVAALMLVCLVLAHYAGGWEHGIYKARRRELEILQNKLENEEPGMA